MNTVRFFGPDPISTRLRSTLATIEREVALLPNDADKGAPLRASIADLVSQLALGPEPEVRDCPKCGCTGMKAATVCGNCWVKLTPPA